MPRSRPAFPRPSWRRRRPRKRRTGAGSRPSSRSCCRTPDTISGRSGRRGRLRPPVEVDPSLVEVRRGVEGDAALGDRTVEVLDRAEVLVGERLVGHRPEALGRPELGAVGRQVDEPDALGDGQPGLRVPAGVVEDEDDDPVATGAGLAGEEGEERLEERLRHPVRQVPEDLARGRLHDGDHVEPLEAVVAGRARSLAPGRPDAAKDRLQPDAVLVRGEDFDGLARVLPRLFGEDGGELFLRHLILPCQKLGPISRTCGEAAGRGRGWRAGKRGSTTTSGGWATCWATPTGAGRCAPTPPGCCCRASARASSRWRPASTRPGSGRPTSRCTTSSPRSPGTMTPCWRPCGPTRSPR